MKTATNSPRRITRSIGASVLLPLLLAWPMPAPGQTGFTVEQVRSYPFPNELTASATGERIAWAFNEAGLRNLWVAEGPQFVARRLTGYERDDGQELTSVQLTREGDRVVYVRGGEHSANWSGSPPNPTSATSAPLVEIWSVPFSGGEPTRLAEGDSPVISPTGDRVAFERNGEIWVVPVDGSAEPRRMFYAVGSSAGPTWSPDGTRLAFVSRRGDHSFVGIFSDTTRPVTWIAPSTSRDNTPVWSPDGTRLAFIRAPGAGGAPDSVLARRARPWAIWTADATTGEAVEVWRSPDEWRGARPTTHGGANLHWAAGDRLIFATLLDGWSHLYSMPASGGEPTLLTPGEYMVEYVSLSPDRRTLLFSANTGPDPLDLDRRHLVRVPVDRAEPEVLTPGEGIEWAPRVTGTGEHIVFLGSTATRPPLPAVMPVSGGTPRLLAEERVPSDFPTDELVVPRQVVFTAADGVRVHAQLFEPRGGAGPRPAVIFAHGGPPRQMLLGWHYSDYYANAYALNQYLASRGFVVLSVNYRLGIGYGDDFHRPANAGSRGASEYLDIRAAGEYLAALDGVDPERIGIYGGSYGGFLTAMALARDSDLFAAGVDIHGVHDWTAERARGLLERDRYERAPDAEEALEVAWRSSPISAIDGWTSPVLLIHGDDDRNVRFGQTVDLVQRLRARGIDYEALVIPDDTHHFMRHANWVRVDEATAEFLERTLAPNGARR